ncbi:MAG TPA: hypothetical protein PKA82_02770 [Pyrinomonadaceae bacterium]|nr:hypothetical protein [Pyrinomonadaceae bacterium]
MLTRGSKGIDAGFLIGTIVTVTFAAATGYLNIVVLYLFGVPLLGLVAGLLVLWLSRSRTLYKVLVSLSILPIIIVSFLGWRWINSARPEVFLLPSGFRGEFVIFYEEPCGADEKMEGKNRLYEIPASGVLILNADSNPGLLNRRFYFVEENGRRVEFPEFGRQKFEIEMKEWDLYGNRSSIEPTLTRQTVGAFWAYGSGTAAIPNRSTGYIIANYDDWESMPNTATTEMRRDLVNRAKELMRTCQERALN